MEELIKLKSLCKEGLLQITTYNNKMESERKSQETKQVKRETRVIP